MSTNYSQLNLLLWAIGSTVDPSAQIGYKRRPITPWTGLWRSPLLKSDMPLNEENDAKEEYSDEGRVHANRLQLLSFIGSVSNNVQLSNEERDRQLRTNKEEYNKIVDRLHEGDNSRRFDPLDKLPVEIWQSILYRVACFTLRPRVNVFHRIIPEDFFVFMLVSKRWLQSIINTPFLWTTILLNMNIPDNLSRIRTHLKLSRELPIFLRITIPFPGWIETVPFLAENRHRISVIEINSRTLKYGNSREAVSEIETYLNDLLPLPKLWRVDLFGMISSPGTLSLVQKLLLGCPSFSSIMNVNITKDILELDSALRLQSFQTTQDLSGLVQKRFPKLFDIKFSHSSTQLSTESTTGDHLLAWQHFWSMNTPPSLTIISRLTNLVTFESQVNGPVLKELLCRLHLVVRLSKLTLWIVYEEQYKAQLPSDEEIKPCYRPTILEISFNSILGTRLAINDVRIYFDRVQELVLRALPSIEELTLRSTHVVPAQFMDSRTFSRLSTLHLNSIPHLGVDITLSPSIKNLYFIDSYNWLGGFPKLSSSSIQRLIMDSWAYPTKFEPEKWPALTSLTISVHHVVEISTRFENLRNLVLRNSSGIHIPQDPTNDPITRFCRNLAMNPSRLPVLESLCLGQLPEWDIFFIMLERRNITKAQGLSRLKKITLPRHYPKELFRPIHDLIRGRFATRPSNWNLSFAGNLELLEDITV
jgi:hypothetical protein